MTTAIKKKFPLAFHVGNDGEVHTIRFDDSLLEFTATCGKKVSVKTGEVERDEQVQITCEKCLDAYTERFTWTIKFTVHPTWVADGFDLTDERALDMLSHDLSYANIGEELDAKVIEAPDADEIAMEQGYESAEHMRKVEGL